jgi:hypothetical protein
MRFVIALLSLGPLGAPGAALLLPCARPARPSSEPDIDDIWGGEKRKGLLR